MQWPKGQTTIYEQTYKLKYRVKRNLLKTGGELRCSGKVSSSCSTSDTSRVNLVTKPVISHEWGKDREVFTTNYTCPGIPPEIGIVATGKMIKWMEAMISNIKPFDL